MGESSEERLHGNLILLFFFKFGYALSPRYAKKETELKIMKISIRHIGDDGGDKERGSERDKVKALNDGYHNL
jgi:hypothetical protein